jgi:hypothetical protein
MQIKRLRWPAIAAVQKRRRGGEACRIRAARRLFGQLFLGVTLSQNVAPCQPSRLVRQRRGFLISTPSSVISTPRALNWLIIGGDA